MRPELARRKLNHAVAKGRLVRPDSCQRCGTTPGRAADGRAAIQAHHHDYSKPYDVEWVCAKCHRAETPFPAQSGGPSFGEKNGQSRLTMTIVHEARTLRANGMSYEKIAARYGVHHSTVQRALTGVHWLTAAQEGR